MEEGGGGAKVPAFADSSVRDRKKMGGGNKGRPPALGGTREYKQSDRGSVEGGGFVCVTITYSSLFILGTFRANITFMNFIFPYRYLIGQL